MGLQRDDPLFPCHTRSALDSEHYGNVGTVDIRIKQSDAPAPCRQCDREVGGNR